MVHPLILILMVHINMVHIPMVVVHNPITNNKMRPVLCTTITTLLPFHLILILMDNIHHILHLEILWEKPWPL
jgi:hypothetical protein